MTDPALTEFERRLTVLLEAHAASARDPRPTARIAADAMRVPRTRRWWPWSGRLAPVLAAALVLPIVLLLAGVDRSHRGADEARAVVVRRAGDALDVVLIDASGSERRLRRLTAEGLGLGPDHPLEQGGSLTDEGWLQVHALTPGATRASPRQYLAVLVDLADPARPPVVVPGNGFTGGRWGPSGQYALYCGDPPDCGQAEVAEPNIGSARAARVLIPADGPGSERIVEGVQLHGGVPEIIWAADGSGFLAGGPGAWGVTPLDGGRVVPGFPRVISRWVGQPGLLGGDGPDAITQVTSPEGSAQVWYRDQLAPAEPLSAQFSADGSAMWLLLAEGSPDAPVALLAHLTGPGRIDAVTRVALPAGTSASWVRLSSDDGFAALTIDDGSDWPFVLAPTTPGGVAVDPSPVLGGLLIGLVPAANADGWPSG
jgi:hypothetical protein